MNTTLSTLGLTPAQVAAMTAGFVRPASRTNLSPKPPRKRRGPPPPRTIFRRDLPTPTVIQQVRERVAAGERQTKIAFELNLARSTVSRIARGNSYQADPGPITHVRESCQQHKGRILTPDQARRIREHAAAGVPVMDISRHYGVSHAIVSRIIRGLNYTDCPGPILYIAPRARMGGAK